MPLQKANLIKKRKAIEIISDESDSVESDVEDENDKNRTQVNSANVVLKTVEGKIDLLSFIISG